MKDESFLVPSAMSGDDLQLVRDQLELLLVSKYFKSAKQMQRFLEYIVERTIAGESRFIKQYTIGVEALGFADDFYPDEDPSVRILGGRVRQRLAEYYGDKNNTNELIIDLPKGSYIPKFNKNAVVKTKANANADSTTLVSCGPTLALVSFSDKTQDQYTNSILFQITDTLATELSRFLSLKLMVCNPFAEKEFSHLAEVEMNFSHKADYILLSIYSKVR